jgi:hypothetical protein
VSPSHEWIYDLDTKEIINSVKTLISFLDIKAEIDTNIENYNKQIESNEESKDDE